MILKIVKKNKEMVEVQILNNVEVVDLLIIPLDFRFDTVLVTSIDKLLKKNRITRVSLTDIVLEGFVDDSSMSCIIAKTVAEALKTK